ncbi:MAG: hypothetical protein ABFD91_08985 [Anaerohalosphaeraceae bacterium]
MRKRIFGLVVSVLFVVCILLPSIISSVQNKEMIIKDRVHKLQSWQELVKKYKEKNDRQYFTLFDVCAYAYQNDSPLPSFVVSTSSEQALSAEQKRQIDEDPLIFKKLVQYELLIGEHGWYILELNCGFLYTKGLFMIDQDGHVSEIKQTKLKDQDDQLF